MPVYISSYEIKDERFACVWETDKRCLMQGGTGETRKERIYTLKHNMEE